MATIDTIEGTVGGAISFQDGASNVTLQTLANVPSGIQVNPRGTSGNGGSISLNAASLTWTTALSSPLSLNVAGVGSGSGGKASITVASATAVTIGSQVGNFQFYAASGSSGGNGGSASLSTHGSISVDTTALLVGPMGASGNGGSIQLSGSTIAPTLGSTLVLIANGVGTGNGGSISLSSNAANAITVGTPLIGNNFELIATSGLLGGNGGTVSVSSGANLTVNPAGISILPLGKNGNGGSLNFSAGTVAAGNLLVNSAKLNASGKGTGSGGTIILSSNSAVPFNLGSIALSNVNGVHGAVSVTGINNGSIVISNNGGAVLNTVALSAVGSVQFNSNGPITIAAPVGTGTTNSISLNALGSGTILATNASDLISAKNLSIQTNAGTIGGSTALLALPVNSNSIGLVSTSGAINVNDHALNTIKLNASNTSANFTLTTSGSINVNGIVSAGATAQLLLSTTGLISNTVPADVLNAGTVTLKAGTGIGSSAAALQFNATTIVPNSPGLINLNDLSAAPLTLAGSNTVKSLSLSALGAININAIVGAPTTAVSLSSPGGNITTSGVGVIKGSLVTINAGTAASIGAAASPLQIVASSLAAFAGGIVNINDASKGAINILNSTSGGNFTLTTSGATTLHNIAAGNGSISVIDSSGSLQTAAASGFLPGALISATNGSITLENSNLTLGSIILGLDTAIATAGPSGGAVNIVIGAPVQVAGTAPSASTVQINHIAAGSVFFGTKGITAVAPLNVLNLNGSNIVFSTGKLAASSIKLGGSVSITADPSLAPGLYAQASPLSSAYAALPAQNTSPLSSSAISIVAPKSAPGQAPASNTIFEAGAENLPAANLPQLSLTLTPSISMLPTATLPQVSTAPFQSLYTETPVATDMNPKNLGSLSSPDFQTTQTSEIPSSVFRAAISSISESELQNGLVPGVVFGGASTGIIPAVSTKLDISGDNRPYLNKGTVVFTPESELIVDTEYGSVKIAGGSTVLLMKFGAGLAVFNLDDCKSGSVVIDVAGHKIMLQPGRHLSITSTRASNYGDVNPAELIGHRSMRSCALPNGLKCFSSEFSIPQAISVVLPLRQLICAKDLHSRRTSNHMLKTAVGLMQLNGQGYERITRSQVTALGY